MFISTIWASIDAQSSVIVVASAAAGVRYEHNTANTFLNRRP
jgi:hypothetical protein